MAVISSDMASGFDRLPVYSSQVKERANTLQKYSVPMMCVF